MANANRYTNEYSLPFENSKDELNGFYYQQDQGTFDYISTHQSVTQDMDSLIYTQQHGVSDKTLRGVVTATPGMVYLGQKEQCVYTTTNSGGISSCTTSAQNTLPMMTCSSSSSSMGADANTMTMTTSNSTTITFSTWTPSASPASTSSSSSACMNAPLLLPDSSSTDPSFLPSSSSSSFSSSLSLGIKFESMNCILDNSGTQQHQSMDDNHSKSLDYPLPMTRLCQQQHAIPNSSTSPTFMASSQRSSLTSAPSPRTTDLPTMTMSISAPTTMISNNDIQTSPFHFQHSMALSFPQSLQNKDDHDTLPMDRSQTQTSSSSTNSTELRRQIHIQSEQKRRAQIKDGFEELRNHLPSCLNKKMSKVALLQRTVQHIQHLKSTQMAILSELERLMNENEHLKAFQENASQHPGSVKPYHNPNSL